MSDAILQNRPVQGWICRMKRTREIAPGVVDERGELIIRVGSDQSKDDLKPIRNLESRSTAKSPTLALTARAIDSASVVDKCLTMLIATGTLRPRPAPPGPCFPHVPSVSPEADPVDDCRPFDDKSLARPAEPRLRCFRKRTGMPLPSDTTMHMAASRAGCKAGLQREEFSTSPCRVGSRLRRLLLQLGRVCFSQRGDTTLATLSRIICRYPIQATSGREAVRRESIRLRPYSSRAKVDRRNRPPNHESSRR